MAEPVADEDRKRNLAPVGALFVGIVAAKNLARRGDDRPLRAMEHAEKLRKAGAGESRIYAETNKMLEGSPYAGVSYGADKKPRFEISDHNAKLVPSALDKTGRGAQANFLRHEDYYKAHPDAAALDVMKEGKVGGGYTGREVLIGDSNFARSNLLGRPRANPTARGVNLHELQHHAQGVEGFAPGGSPKDFEKKFPGDENADLRRKLYDSLAGEVEAENTRKRANMTPAERRAIHPSKTAEFARKDQIVTDKHGRVQEIFNPKSATVTKLHTGAAVKFDYDRDAVTDFKKTFPKARWSPDTKTWHVPGKLAGNRVDRWVAIQSDVAGKQTRAEQVAKDAASFDKPIESPFVRKGASGYAVKTPYHVDLVDKMRSIPGSQFDRNSKAWIVPFRSAESLRTALPDVERIAQPIVAAEKARDAKIAADRAAQRAQWDKENAARRAADDARMARVRANRYLELSSRNPKTGDTIRLNGKAVTVESIGKMFRADENTSSVSRLIGVEGERVNYVYHREATAVEAAQLELREEAAKQRQVLTNIARSAKAEIEAKFQTVKPAKKMGEIPAGETLAHFGKQNAIYGGGTEYRLSADGKSIWRIQGNSADGDNWSANNAPGSIVSKIRATKDAIAKLRALGEVETTGLRGTQNPENLRAILEGKAKRAKQAVAESPTPPRIQEMADDGKTPAPTPKGHDQSYRKPVHEVRMDGGNTKRYVVYEDGKQINDSKGAAKWFGTKERAEKYLAGRAAIAKQVAGAPAAKSAVTTTPWQAGSGAGGKLDYHVSRTHTWVEDGIPRSRSEPLVDSAGNTRRFASFDAAKKAAATGDAPATTGESSTPKRAPRAAVEAKPRAAVAGDNGGPSDKALKTAAKLEAVARRTIAEAQAVHDQPRLMNTARRARMGSGVMEEQQRKIANAKTALKIAEALRNGEAGPLIKVESLADVERLTDAHRAAMYANEAKRKAHPGSMIGAEPDRGDIAHAKPAEMVRANISPRDIPLIKKALAGKGVARDLARLEKIASEKDGWRLTDPKDIESLSKVAKAIKTLDPKDTSWTEYKWQARSLQSDANRWMGEVREFQAKQRLGLTNQAELRTTLEAFADARVNRKAADPVAVAERALIGQKLPGFFPTPATLAERMAQMADIKPGMQVLEPSAGTGRLADAAKKLGATVDAVEMQSSLRDILLKKGHNVVDHDFTSMKAEPKYDRIVMNPPFEKGQDIEHVKRAYEMLKPGGKMVAVMGEGAFFRGDKKAAEFRNWLESIGSSEKLPDGTFKESNTGVNSRLVTIEKPAGSGPQGWSDAARTASAEARGVAKPGEGLPKAENAHSGYTNPSNRKPAQTVQSAVERAMAMQEAKLKAPQQSALGTTTKTPDRLPTDSRQVSDKTPTPASMSGSGSKRYVTLGDGRKVGLGQYTNAWKQAKAMNLETGVRGTPSDPNGGGTAGDVVREMRAGMVDRINQKDPNFGKGRKWDPTWQNDARRLADTLARKSEVPAGEAHPVDLRAKVADRLAPDTKLPPKGGTGVKGKVMGLMAPVAIGSAALVAMNESAKAGETKTKQVTAGAVEAGKGAAVMGGFMAATVGITKGLMKAGMTAARAVPATQGILMAGGAIHGAVTAKPGERMKGAARGAWDMSLPGMVINTVSAGKVAWQSTAERIGTNGRITAEQSRQFDAANKDYANNQDASGTIMVEQFDRSRRLPSGQVVSETVHAHTRRRTQ